MDWKKPNISDTVNRPSITDCYKEHMYQYLKGVDPDIGNDFINEFLNNVVKQYSKSPEVTFINHPTPGNAELKKMKMGKYLSKIRDKVVLPFGSSYKPENVEQGFLKIPLSTAKKKRKSSKKLMFKHEREGNTVLKDFYNADQATQKIKMNSAPGAMGSKTSFLSDKAGFNSVTSSARWFLGHAFAMTERLFEGNFYFNSQEAIWNHLILLKSIFPGREKVDRILEKYSLKTIWPEELIEWINSIYMLYNGYNVSSDIIRWLEKEPIQYITFVYYYSNLKHIFMNGVEDGKSIFDKIFSEDVEPDTDDRFLDTLGGDETILLTIVYFEKFPIITKDGKSKQANLDEIRSHYPDVAKQLSGYARHLAKHVDVYQDLFDLFIYTDIVIPNSIMHPMMFRNSVLGGDTDSQLFTTKNWIKWYTDGYILNTPGIRINALLIYFLSKCISRYLYLLSAHLGAVGEGREIMIMKNEYTFPVMVLTNLKKHYMALIAIQEGVVFTKPKKEIKGVAFRGSKLSKTTLDAAETEILRILNDIVTTSEIDFDRCVNNVVEFELDIKDSISEGSTTYYSTLPIRPKEDYNGDSSIHDNYLVWEEVFGDIYGRIPYHSKCTIVPLDLPKVEDLDHYINNSTDKKSKTIYTRLKDVMIKWGKKKLTRIPLNPELTVVPKELVPFIDIPKIINANVSPFYLALRSFGISAGGTLKKPIFFSDIYITKASELRNKK